MSRVLDWVLGIVIAVAIGIGVFALLNWVGWLELTAAHHSTGTILWSGAFFGVCAFFGPKLIEYSVKRGWIQSDFFDSKKKKELEDRRNQLAVEREEILKNARK